MLVLTRRENESVVIGDNVEITVLYVSGKKVRLGISAPKDISIHRKEIYQAIQLQMRKNGDEEASEGDTAALAERLITKSKANHPATSKQNPKRTVLNTNTPAQNSTGAASSKV